ncbi:hypothetical protein LPJ78_004954 [Coemansia sp. RSA 989]|nr:hypothetical protein LPJ78_004954 [Coemansia sp. RSA 989]
MVSETKVVPAFLGGFICIYGLVSGFVKERLFLSESLVAMVFGILLGPKVINAVDPASFLNVEKFTLEFARYVIAIQVMAAGITLPGRYMVRKWRSMSVVLGPVMVVMWLVTAGIVHLLFEIDFKQSLLIASCAAPTDPILANSVVKGRYAEANVPKNVRDILSAESGVNDGLGLPFLYFALYLLNESYSTRHAIGKWFYWTWCYNILLSVAIGIAVGYIARKLLRLAESYDLIDKESFLAFSIGLAIFIVGCLQLIRSDDVLCCFIAGHSFTWDDWFREETKDAHFQEVLDGLINVTFFIYFGTIIPWSQFNNAELTIAPWRLIVAAIMVLLLRRLPVVVLLTRITPAFRNYRQSLFAGWFGPIGVGALFFSEIVLEEIEAEPEHFHLRSREIIQPIVSFLVFSSVLVHGVTLPLLYIGKVVRSHSRSFSTMSIRNGIASRLSFVNSREPSGVHGVQIPMMDSSLSNEFVEQEKHRNDRPEFEVEPESVSTARSSPSEGEKDRGPAAPLDLVRTITIDDTPKVARDQMDIHYRIPQSHVQFRQHVQKHAPTALHAPSYSHLHPEAPARSHSAQEVEISVNVPADMSSNEAADVEPPQPAHMRSHEHRMSGASETRSDTHVPALQQPSDSTMHDFSGSSGSEGLVMAADPQHASRVPTQQPTVSSPEVQPLERPSSATHIEMSPISRRSSLPAAMPIPASIPASSVHSETGTHATSHITNEDHFSHYRRPHIHNVNTRRVLRRRRRQQPTDAEIDEIGGPACEYVGNRRNPLGRLEDGELVDYDDPNDNDLEVSFMDNNVDDRFIDYLSVDLGNGIRRLRSILPSIGRHQSQQSEHNNA